MCIDSFAFPQEPAPGRRAPARKGSSDSEWARLAALFRTELDEGCLNRTVSGGLDRLLVNLVEGGKVRGHRDLVRRVRALPDAGYRALSVDQREAWVRGTLAVLAGLSKTPEGESGRQSRPAGGSRSQGPLTLDSPTTRLPGIGRAAAAKLEKLGVRVAGDAVRHFPRRYSDFSDVRPIGRLEVGGGPVTVVGKIERVSAVGFGRRKRRTEATITDDTGRLKIIWFNMPYVAKALAGQEMLAVSGRVRIYRGRLQMENPDYEPFDADLVHTGRMVPVYPATAGLSQRTIRRAVKTAVDALAPLVPDPIPAEFTGERKPSLEQAIRAMHYPDSQEEAERARRRLALGEFLAIQCAVLQRRARWQRQRDAPRLSLDASRAEFLSSLPFELTADQKRTLAEISTDIAADVPMLRLLQGDVGSGKTVVAFAAIMAAVASGSQAALMAPTEILADQHYRSFVSLLGGEATAALDGMFAPPWLDRPVRLVLLTGSLPASEKERLRNDTAHGGADILIGTHALLEEGVSIPRLGLAVIDEQHRFGVAQRQRLREKGANPHLLVMTATPIPRTLALTVYGDLEASVIAEMPPGRRPVKTVWVQPEERDEAYGFLRERLDAGEQAFVICPLVEGSEALDVRAAEDEYEALRRGPLRNYRVALLHGRMPGRQKDEVMSRFAAGEFHALVSTSVIEVGIDVPAATVIVIEGAERFGLSQLHQFRGRVGRSDAQSYCLLFASTDDPGPDAVRRLQAMLESDSGFELAEIDLELRGEGEAWGTEQSGLNSMLKVARLTDRDLLIRGREMAARVLEADPDLQLARHRVLAAAVKPFVDEATEAN
ncbi:MAG: ATP-dependent DNA helicase RecG [Dehalococcoidia bacterium]